MKAAGAKIVADAIPSPPMAIGRDNCVLAWSVIFAPSINVRCSMIRVSKVLSSVVMYSAGHVRSVNINFGTPKHDRTRANSI